MASAAQYCLWGCLLTLPKCECKNFNNKGVLKNFSMICTVSCLTFLAGAKITDVHQPSKPTLSPNLTISKLLKQFFTSVKGRVLNLFYPKGGEYQT